LNRAADGAAVAAHALRWRTLQCEKIRTIGECAACFFEEAILGPGFNSLASLASVG
jgi:hypothetical protein